MEALIRAKAVIKDNLKKSSGALFIETNAGSLAKSKLSNIKNNF